MAHKAEIFFTRALFIECRTSRIIVPRSQLATWATALPLWCGRVRDSTKRLYAESMRDESDADFNPNTEIIKADKTARQVSRERICNLDSN